MPTVNLLFRHAQQMQKLHVTDFAAVGDAAAFAESVRQVLQRAERAPQPRRERAFPDREPQPQKLEYEYTRESLQQNAARIILQNQARLVASQKFGDLRMKRIAQRGAADVKANCL